MHSLTLHSSPFFFNSASLLCLGMTHYTVHPLFSCSTPVLVTAVLQATNSCPQTDGLFTGDSGCACSPSRFTIVFTTVSQKSVHETVAPQWLAQSMSTAITEVAFCWWSMNIYQHVHVTFVLHIVVVMSPLVLTVTSAHLSFSVLLLGSSSIPYSLG
jgi:hypothetical protein